MDRCERCGLEHEQLLDLYICTDCGVILCVAQVHKDHTAAQDGIWFHKRFGEKPKFKYNCGPVYLRSITGKVVVDGSS